MPTEGLRKRILTATSGAEWNALGRETAVAEDGFEVLIELLGNPHAAIAKRAGYVFSHTGEYAPARTVAHLAELVPLLECDVHPSTRRALCRALTFVDLPEAWLGPVLDRCFDYLENEEEKVAVRAFSADIIYRNTKSYPELRAELKRLLEWAAPTGSPGLKSKARQLVPLLTD